MDEVICLNAKIQMARKCLKMAQQELSHPQVTNADVKNFSDRLLFEIVTMSFAARNLQEKVI